MRASGRVAATRVRAIACSAPAGSGCAPERAPIDVEIHAGELVGVAGLEGHGQDRFLRRCAGAGAVAGEVVLP